MGHPHGRPLANPVAAASRSHSVTTINERQMTIRLDLYPRRLGRRTRLSRAKRGILCPAWDRNFRRVVGEAVRCLALRHRIRRTCRGARVSPVGGGRPFSSADRAAAEVTMRRLNSRSWSPRRRLGLEARQPDSGPVPRAPAVRFLAEACGWPGQGPAQHLPARRRIPAPKALPDRGAAGSTRTPIPRSAPRLSTWNATPARSRPSRSTSPS